MNRIAIINDSDINLALLKHPVTRPDGGEPLPFVDAPTPACSYKPPREPESAVVFPKGSRGTHFDPKRTEALMAAWRK